jgi:hypothetical protein
MIASLKFQQLVSDKTDDPGSKPADQYENNSVK